MLAPAFGAAIVRMKQQEVSRRAEEARRLRSSEPDPGTPEPPRRASIRPLPPRAVTVGSVVEVGGALPLGPDGRIAHRNDPYGQMRTALRLVGETLRGAGSGLDRVVRTRVYLKKSWQWREVARAHRDVFGGEEPVTTFVGAGGFADPDALVQVEATARVS
jgi:enamine deaminase RidA (YjgF/YER057c/UK114 family)